MRRPICSLLIAGCLIAMTLFLIGCEDGTFEYFTDDWFIANDYFPISLVPYGDWEITVTENTISDETVENEEGGEDNLNVTDTRTRTFTIDSTTPKTVSIDFTTLEPTE